VIEFAGIKVGRHRRGVEEKAEAWRRAGDRNCRRDSSGSETAAAVASAMGTEASDLRHP
jgi:hypothetical protein